MRPRSSQGSPARAAEPIDTANSAAAVNNPESLQMSFNMAALSDVRAESNWVTRRKPYLYGWFPPRDRDIRRERALDAVSKGDHGS
jgi:hypothetical protein